MSKLKPYLVAVVLLVALAAGRVIAQQLAEADQSGLYPQGAVIAPEGQALAAGTAGKIGPIKVDAQGRLLVRFDHPRRFACGVAGQAASLLECAAVVASNSYYITDIVAGSSTTTAGDFAIQSGTGTNCGTGTATVWPPAPATTASRYKAPPNTSPPTVISLTTPIKVTQGHAVCLIGMATQTLNATISGYIAP